MSGTLECIFGVCRTQGFSHMSPCRATRMAKLSQKSPKPSKICRNWVLLVFLCQKPCICGQIWMKWHQMSFLALFWLFLAQFGHSGSPVWAHMIVPLGSTHTKNTFKCPRHFHRQKKSLETNFLGLNLVWLKIG